MHATMKVPRWKIPKPFADLLSFSELFKLFGRITIQTLWYEVFRGQIFELEHIKGIHRQQLLKSAANLSFYQVLSVCETTHGDIKMTEGSFCFEKSKKINKTFIWIQSVHWLGEFEVDLSGPVIFFHEISSSPDVPLFSWEKRRSQTLLRAQ